VAIVVDIRNMRDDFKSFGRAARSFIQNKQRLPDLETQLSYAASEAKRGDRRVTWSTDVGSGGPVRTELSSSYRSHEACHKPIFAEVSFNFAGELILRTITNSWFDRAGRECACVGTKLMERRFTILILP